MDWIGLDWIGLDWKRLQTKLLDVTLCDFLPPGMDGLDRMQQYQDWEKAPRPWFSQWTSGHARELDVERGRLIGMDDFMPKPVTSQHLTDLLNSGDQIVACKRLDCVATKALEDIQDEPIRKRLKTSSSEPGSNVQVIAWYWHAHQQQCTTNYSSRKPLRTVYGNRQRLMAIAKHGLY